MSPRTESTIIFYDLEATGLNYFYDSITEIGAITDNGNTFQTFVNPLIPIPSKITELTGITNDMVANAPTIKDALYQFLTFICNESKHKHIYLVAHNGNNYDHLFLKRYFRQFNINTPAITYFDTIPLSKLVNPERFSHSLKNICNYYNIEQLQAHRADDDARCLREVYNNLVLKFKYIDICTNINHIYKLSHL